MGLQDIYNSKFFSNRYKFPVHIIEIILVIIVIGFSVPRLFLKNQPRTRANTIALGMGAKSLIVIGYQLLCDHVQRFRKYRSYKAYAVLNGLELVFWGAVVFLVMQANLGKNPSHGIALTLSWVVVAVSAIINQLAVYMLIVTYREFREYRKEHPKGSHRHEAQRGHFQKTTSKDSQELHHLPSYAENNRALSPQPSRAQAQSPFDDMERGRVDNIYKPPRSYSPSPAPARYEMRA